MEIVSISASETDTLVLRKWGHRIPLSEVLLWNSALKVTMNNV